MTKISCRNKFSKVVLLAKIRSESTDLKEAASTHRLLESASLLLITNRPMQTIKLGQSNAQCKRQNVFFLSVRVNLINQAPTQNPVEKAEAALKCLAEESLDTVPMYVPYMQSERCESYSQSLPNCQSFFSQATKTFTSATRCPCCSYHIVHSHKPTTNCF